MDDNKLKKLKSVEYKEQLCCYNCLHSDFNSNDFGLCCEIEYNHLKHTDKKRKLSIHKTGHCNKHKLIREVHVANFFNLIEDTVKVANRT